MNMHVHTVAPSRLVSCGAALMHNWLHLHVCDGCSVCKGRQMQRGLLPHLSLYVVATYLVIRQAFHVADHMEFLKQRTTNWRRAKGLSSPSWYPNQLGKSLSPSKGCMHRWSYPGSASDNDSFHANPHMKGCLCCSPLTIIARNTTVRITRTSQIKIHFR